MTNRRPSVMLALACLVLPLAGCGLGVTSGPLIIVIVGLAGLLLVGSGCGDIPLTWPDNGGVVGDDLNQAVVSISAQCV